MTTEALAQRFRELCTQTIPLPAGGDTPARHRKLMAVGTEDLSLAKLAEAHWDALAILAEAGRQPAPGALYAVWASEIPGQALRLEPHGAGYTVSGKKAFCSGIGLMDRALITTGQPEQRIVEVDLHSNHAAIATDCSAWKSDAFHATNTGAVTFNDLTVSASDLIGEPGWYLTRPGFWHGALGPAACWAGGAEGLLHIALQSTRADPHTLAHLGAISANVWAMKSYLETAGREIDLAPLDRDAAEVRALQVRHLIEQVCTDTLRRFARAYGPHPLSMDAEASRRYHELDLYLRQSHAERDLEALGHKLKSSN